MPEVWISAMTKLDKRQLGYLSRTIMPELYKCQAQKQERNHKDIQHQSLHPTPGDVWSFVDFIISLVKVPSGTFGSKENVTFINGKYGRCLIPINNVFKYIQILKRGSFYRMPLFVFQFTAVPPYVLQTQPEFQEFLFFEGISSDMHRN